MAFRQDDLGTPRTPPAPAEPSGNWDLFRGIAARESASAARSRKLIRIGALCLLVLGVSVGLTMMVLRLRNRIPSLYSAARAEVVSVAAKFRPEPATRRVADPEPPSRTVRRASRRVQSRAQAGAASRDRTPKPFDVYLVEDGRQVLISSMGHVAILDMATGNLSWVRDRYLTP